MAKKKGDLKTELETALAQELARLPHLEPGDRYKVLALAIKWMAVQGRLWDAEQGSGFLDDPDPILDDAPTNGIP